jgi:hypothetical protein
MSDLSLNSNEDLGGLLSGDEYSIVGSVSTSSIVNNLNPLLLDRPFPAPPLSFAFLALPSGPNKNKLCSFTASLPSDPFLPRAVVDRNNEREHTHPKSMRSMARPAAGSE